MRIEQSIGKEMTRTPLTTRKLHAHPCIISTPQIAWTFHPKDFKAILERIPVNCVYTPAGPNQPEPGVEPTVPPMQLRSEYSGQSMQPRSQYPGQSIFSRGQPPYLCNFLTTAPKIIHTAAPKIT